MLQRVAIIINPASGIEFPVLFYLNQVLSQTQIEVEYFITQKAHDAYAMAATALDTGVDAVAVYGGDGTIMEVAQVLSLTTTPLIILPGGSANVMAKELGIPLTLLEALRVFTKEQPTLHKMDMGMCNQKRFMLRVSAGVWEKMITNVRQDQKNKIGQLAYTVPFLEQMSRQKPERYRLHFEQTTQEVVGLGLMITNAGSTGLGNLSYLPDISITDGLLDAVLLQTNDITSLISSVAAVITAQPSAAALRSWQAPAFEVELLDSDSIILDDVTVRTSLLSISVLPGALHVLV